MTDTTVTLRLSADGTVLSAVSRQAGREVAAIGDTATTAGRKAEQGLRRGAAGADGLSRAVQSAKSQLVAMASIAAGLQIARQLGSIADEYANIGARIQLAAGGSVTFAQGQRDVLSVAQQTASTLRSTTDLASKLSTSFRSLGADSELAWRSSIGLTKTIQQAVQLSGASASAADAAIVQLGQGLASGVLRGEELNSILEQTPRLAQAIAEGMGVTVGQLRALGAEGKITAQAIVEALQTQIPQLQAEFDKLPLTIGRAWTRLQNSVVSYIGQADQAAGSSARVAAGIEAISRNIDAVIGGVVRLGEIVVAVYVGKLIRSGALWIASLHAQTVAVTAQGVAVEGMAAKTAASFAATRKEIGLLGIAGNTLFAAFAGWQIGSYLREQFVEVKTGGIELVDDLLAGWERLKAGTSIVWEAIKAAGVGAMNSVRTALASMVQGFADTLRSLPAPGSDVIAARLDSIAASMRPATSAADDFKAALARINSESDAAIAKIHGLTAEMKADAVASAEAGEAAKDNAKEQADLAKDLEELLKQLNQTTNAKDDDTTATKKLTAATGDLAKINREAGAALDRLHGMTASLADENIDLADRIAGADDAQIAYNQTMRDANAEFARTLELGPPTAEAIAALGDASDEAARKLDLTRQLDAQRAELAEYRREVERANQTWGQFADAIANALTSGGDVLENLGDALVATLRDIVTRLIAEWLRTEIIGMFTGMGGSGLGGLAQLAGSYFGGGSGGLTGALGGGGGWTQYLGGGANAAGMLLPAAGAAGTYFTGAAGGFVTPMLYGGTTALAGTGSSATLGALGITEWGGAGSATAASGTAATGASAMSTALSWLGWIAAIAYGISKGDQWFQQGWDPGSPANRDAISYENGLRFNPIMVGNDTLGAIFDDRTAAALSGASGFARVWGYRDPVVQNSGYNWQFGPDGAGGQEIYEIKQKGGWFRSDKRWTEYGELSDEMLDQISEFWQGIGDGMSAAARQLGVDVPEMIEASFTEMYDRKGNLKSTIGTILGRTYEESWEEFSKRIAAESIIAVVAAAVGDVPGSLPGTGGAAAEAIAGAGGEAGIVRGGGPGTRPQIKTGELAEAGQAMANEAQLLAERWRDSADTLLDGAQLLLAAQTDIQRGRSLIDATGPGVLTQIVDLVEELGNAGEPMAQTYQRLVIDTENLRTALDLMNTSLVGATTITTNFGPAMLDAEGNLITAGDVAVEQTELTGAAFVRFAAQVEEAAGGLDAANALWSGFFQSFYGMAELSGRQIDDMRDQVTRSLEAIGVDAGVSMSEFRREFEAAMPTLTPEEVVQWLQAANALAQFTQAQRDLIAQASTVLESMGVATGALSAFGRGLQSIYAQRDAAIDAANAIAVAQGREGASAVQLAQIHDWTAKQIAAAIRRLAQETQDIRARLYGGIPGSLEGINARIAELEGAGRGGIDSIGSALDDLFERWQSGIRSLSDYLDQSLFGDLSTLAPEEQLDEAQRQLDAAILAARGGDADALADLPRLMDLYARLLRDSEASGADFNDPINAYRDQLAQLLTLPGPAGEGGGQDPIAVQVSASPELQALYAQRDALLAQQENEYRAGLAQQLAQNLHDLAVLTRTPILDMIELQGVALNQLATDMGVDLDNLTGASVLALGNMATTLGLSLTDLTSALGVSLTDLSGGLTELTDRLGIDLGNLTVESTQTLADLANSLGGDLGDLATSLGIDLGDLADAQSLMNDAVEATIAELPEGTRDQLTPLLEAVEQATTEADANAAIAELEAAVNEIGGATATALAPYLGGVVPPDALDQLDYLEDVKDIGAEQLDVLRDIARGLDVPGYAVGSAHIKGDQLAQLHDGEMVIDPATSHALRTYGIRVTGGGGSDPALLAEVRALRAELVEVKRTLAERIDRNTDATRDEGAKDRVQREDIARRAPQQLDRRFG